MPKLSNFPSTFNGPQSPMLANDSPFPMLKADYRYRGVYERAGFDVNLNGYKSGMHSPSDTRTMALARKQPASPASLNFGFPSAKGPSKHVNQSLRSLPMSSHRRDNVSPTESRSSAGKAAAAATTATHPYSTSSNNSYHDPASAPASAHPVNAPDRFQLPKKAPIEVQPPQHNQQQQQHAAYQAFQPFKPDTEKIMVLDDQGNPKIIDSQPDVPPRADRNIKGLRVHIPHSTHNICNTHNADFSKPDTTFSTQSPSGRESESDYNSPTFDHTEQASTAHTSATSSNEFRKNSLDSAASVKTSELVKSTPYPTLNDIPVIQEHQDLSSMLESFRLDVEDHKNLKFKNSPSASKVLDNSSQLTPDTTSHSMGLDDNNSSESSFNFTGEQVGHSDMTKGHSSHEYQDFLNASAAGDRKNIRNSNLSTISSIISKLNDGNDDREDDVDPELHRQLESLKMGGEIPSVSPARKPTDTDSFVTASNLPEHANPNAAVPVFNIQDVSEKLEADNDNDDSSVAKFREASSPSSDVSNPFYEGNDNPPQAKEGHLISDVSSNDLEAVDLNEDIETKAPRTPYNPGGEFDDDPFTHETPETIKPLSPKNHRIEEELKDMNFRYEPDIPRVEAASEYPKITEGDDILMRNRLTSEFNPFPQSVIGTQYPKFRDSDMPMKTPPGLGRCRGCGEDVDKNAKGSRKAIFSKTGELSGQWHRGCFSCSFTGCEVNFDKHTPCYVLLDNAFCKHHYHLLNGTLCQTCNSGIEGECIENEMRQKWHTDCLKCNRCHGGIRDDYFLINGEIVCEKDANVLIKKMEKEGMLCTDKIEKRRTRMMFVDQVPEF